MSSFVRRRAPTQAKPVEGTRLVSGSSSLLQVSTGLQSLDDLLGGGLPLGQVLLILAPDYHSSWGELLARYFVSQGLSSGHHVLVSDRNPAQFVSGCMWYPGSSRDQPVKDMRDKEVDEQTTGEQEDVKIAWRYGHMKQFKTTVENVEGTEDYCRTFDLATTIPNAVISHAVEEKRLLYEDVSPQTTPDPSKATLQKLRSLIGVDIQEKTPLRVCINNLGDFPWGPLQARDVLNLLLHLRSSIRNSTACALVTLPPRLSHPEFSPEWIEKLSHLSDGCITFQGITSDAVLGSAFPSYSGLLRVHSTPSPHTLLDPSRRFSQLRGLDASGKAENNLAFKCMRKRFVVETLHLDVEGGVGERRTTPATSTITSSSVPINMEFHPHHAQPADTGIAKVSIEAPTPLAPSTDSVSEQTGEKKPKKARKKVAFHSEGADYEF